MSKAALTSNRASRVTRLPSMAPTLIRLNGQPVLSPPRWSHADSLDTGFPGSAYPEFLNYDVVEQLSEILWVRSGASVAFRVSGVGL